MDISPERPKLSEHHSFNDSFGIRGNIDNLLLLGEKFPAGKQSMSPHKHLHRRFQINISRYFETRGRLELGTFEPLPNPPL